MTNKLVIFCVFSVFLTIVFITPSLIEAKDKIKYVGSSTVGVFMKDAANVYSNATFQINTNPESGGGETATATGKTDIGGVARAVKPGILKKGVQAVLIGKDAIGAWVNTSNPLKKLTIEELKGIFTGKITNWKQVGGNDAIINVYVVNPQSATRKVFGKVVLQGKKYFGKNIKTIRPDPAILDIIAKDKDGIGHLSFALGSGHPAGNKVKKINIGEQDASVNNPNYPITRPLHLITKGKPTGATKDFINWAISKQGQAIVKKYFVGIE